jgi:hypothetical protein
MPTQSARTGPRTRLRNQRRPALLDATLRVLVAGGLGVDAFVHAHLAGSYDANVASISQGDLFRIEAGLACLAAVLVLALGSWPGFGLAFLVAAAGLGAVLLYRYVDVGRLGPFPNMYEPVWYTDKTVSAVAEATAALLAAAGLLLDVLRRRARR